MRGFGHPLLCCGFDDGKAELVFGHQRAARKHRDLDIVIAQRRNAGQINLRLKNAGRDEAHMIRALEEKPLLRA